MQDEIVEKLTRELACLSGCFSILPDLGVSLHGHATSTCGLLKQPDKLERAKGGITAEAQTIYLLVQIRKLMEHNSKKLLMP